GRPAAHQVHYQAHLLGRHAYVFALRVYLGHGLGASAGAAATPATFSLVTWPRNVRVAANSPSLCPTVFSVTYLRTSRRPSWTAIVWPTICGKMVLARLQVRMTFLSPRWFIASTFFSSLGSTNGPFFNDLDISTPSVGRAQDFGHASFLASNLPPLAPHYRR